MNLANHIKSDPYLRERLDPQPGDGTYLHLSDLRMAVANVASNEALTLLDYGCGGSPYRSLFPNADYRRADYLQGEGEHLDYVLKEDSRITEKDETFDFILSTQVLEHVGEPATYLGECYRLLKPGGLLYVTTHGFYPDHGCPYDFYRWTGDGLSRELKSRGFAVLRVEKQTTGPRAFFHHCDYQLGAIHAPRRTLFGVLLYLVRILHGRLKPWIHRMCDKYFPDCRVVTNDLENHPTYAVVSCLARKQEQ